MGCKHRHRVMEVQCWHEAKHLLWQMLEKWGVRLFLIQLAHMLRTKRSDKLFPTDEHHDHCEWNVRNAAGDAE